MRRLLVPLALLCSLSFVPVCETSACSCVGPGSPAQARESADAVFTGRVVRIRDDLRTLDPAEGGWPRRMVTLEVDRAWKGVREGTVIVETGLGGGDCGYGFREGQRYLVYAHSIDEASTRLGTGICSRTAPESRAGEDLRVLGEPMRTWGRGSR